MSKLTVYRGDDKTYNLHFVDGAGANINITGWTVFFTVKPYPLDSYDAADTGAVISKTVTSHTTPLDGKTAIVIADTELILLPIGVYMYDIQIKKADGAIKTIVVSSFTVLQDITRRIV